MPLTDGLDLIRNRSYAEQGVPHDTWAQLRKDAPVHYCEPGHDFSPYWAITKHADICEVSKQPDLFRSSDGIVMLAQTGEAALRGSGEGLGAMRVIIEMDPPEHRAYRQVASPVFTPRAIQALDAAIDQSARSIVDRLAGESGEGECDFANDVAAAHPLRILSTMLGVPRESEPDILRLTNELFANDDPDLQREGEDREAAALALGLELYQLFDGIIQERRANPTDDLASLLANATIDGEPMPMMETVGYYLITFSAGHDTTKNALASGVCALAQNSEEFEKLKRNPDLIDSAVEEILRWTSPVNYMKRVVAKNVDFHGQKLSEGDNLVLFYGSANRDEKVFEDPFSFRVDRNPNPHLGFGIGEHFCIGSHLARASLRAMLRELVSRIDSLELTGVPEQIQSSFVVGLKELPLRYRVSQDADEGAT